MPHSSIQAAQTARGTGALDASTHSPSSAATMHQLRPVSKQREPKTAGLFYANQKAAAIEWSRHASVIDTAGQLGARIGRDCACYFYKLAKTDGDNEETTGLLQLNRTGCCLDLVACASPSGDPFALKHRHSPKRACVSDPPRAQRGLGRACATAAWWESCRWRRGSCQVGRMGNGAMGEPRGLGVMTPSPPSLYVRPQPHNRGALQDAARAVGRRRNEEQRALDVRDLAQPH